MQLSAVNQSYVQSQASLNILMNKEGVNLEPEITLDAQLDKNSQHGTPKLYVTNIGKTEATNLIVQIIRRQFDGKSYVGATWGNGEGGSYIFNELKVYETKEITLPLSYVVEPEFNVLEVRIYYMRAYDKKSYKFRTFFLYGPKDQEYKSWFNIKQARNLVGNPFLKEIDESTKLSTELFGTDTMKYFGTELVNF